MYRHSQENTGEFVEKEYGKCFTYKPTQDTWAIERGFTHEIDVLDGTRYALIMRTQAKVFVDENVIQVWKFKKHTVYNR